MMNAQVAPAKKPDVSDVWRAWRIARTDDPREAVNCGGYLVHAPGAHPFWSFYLVSCVSLADYPGQDEPAVIDFFGATHEFLIVTLDPEHPVPQVDAWERAYYLTPPDVVHQGSLPSDAHAERVLDSIVRAICAGRSPDSDYRAFWNDAIDATCVHEREGKHDE